MVLDGERSKPVERLTTAVEKSRRAWSIMINRIVVVGVN